ncbi:hypothetical protein BGZ52_005175 [Haplosporangium bisporale]|nr:hypothetical protein BGZ52_005175 [Haplosporangium bisporale]
MLAEVYAAHIRNAEEQGTPRSDLIRRVIAGEGTENIRVPHHFVNNAYHGPSGAITLDVNGDRKDGSLTIKNNRIYRIFNSVTMANQAFQTHLLLRFLLLAVVLATAPMVAEVVIDQPAPTMINIRSCQWAQCRGLRTQVWWIVTVVLPSEFYIATFYISTIGIYFTVSLALIVLFALKIYSLWKASHGDDDDDDDDGSFVIRGHGWLGQPVLRGVTDIHQAARVAGINGGIGDNLGFGTFARSPDNLQATRCLQTSAVSWIGF